MGSFEILLGIKDFFLRIFSKKKLAIIKIVIFLALIFKTLIFIVACSSDNGITFKGTWGIYIDYRIILGQIAFLAILMFPMYFFKERRQLSYLIVIDIIYTLLLIGDIWYYRGNRELLGVRHLLFHEMFNPLGDNLINPASMDLLLIFDIPIIIYFRYKLKEKLNYKKNYILGCIGIIACIILIWGTHYLVDIKNIYKGNVQFIKGEWASFVTVQRATPLGYHLYEANLALSKKSIEPNEEEMKKVDDWLAWNEENLPNNEYAGIFKGKNLVFLQIESLENFVINKTVNGKEITPNLNMLIKESLYFKNFYEQNNAGNSIDCDMMANTGLLTLGDSITFLSHPEVKYPSLARDLEKQGYTTVSTHAERGGDWKWAEAHSNALGFSDMWDIASYNIDEHFIIGLADRSFYNQYVDKLKTIKEPFFSMIPTLSSHMPYNIPEGYRELDLPKEIDESYIGGYLECIHYADKQIGYFFERLKEEGLRDDTVVVIYGDHSGVHKYYTEDIKDVPLEGEWWQEGDSRIPLIINGPGIEGKTFDVYGGHSDIAPTIEYLFGVNDSPRVIGRNLLNTNRNATVLKGGVVIGYPKDEEKEKLKESYKIADYIIKNKYYENRGLVD